MQCSQLLRTAIEGLPWIFEYSYRHDNHFLQQQLFLGILGHGSDGEETGRWAYIRSQVIADSCARGRQEYAHIGGERKVSDFFVGSAIRLLQGSPEVLLQLLNSCLVRKRRLLTIGP